MTAPAAPGLAPDSNFLAADPYGALLLARFVKNLPKRMSDLHRAELAGDWREVANQAHQLSGAAGSYGFAEIGRAAALIEAKARPHTASGEAAPGRDLTALVQAIRDFDASCAAAACGERRQGS